MGRYVIFEEFARGGMASIHYGRLLGAQGFSRVVAVKRVRALFLDSDEHKRAILSEARLASRIRHPNVVQTLDIVLDGGVTNVVMEYVHGVTVAELFAEAKVRGERAPAPIAVGIITDALEGLQAAHEARDPSGAPLGIIHRDVTPQNIHVGVDGHARLLDFGIAKALNRTQVTAPGVVKGKIAYMAREQLGGAPVTRQADVYGAGVVLWELLTGRRLFEDGDPALLATRVLTEPIPPPSHDAPEISGALDQIVLRATASDPKQRYETAAEMLAALAGVNRADATEIGGWVERLAGDELELRAERVKHAETADVSAALEPAERATESRKRVFVGAATAALVIIAVGIAFASMRPRATEGLAVPPSGAALPVDPPPVTFAPSTALVTSSPIVPVASASISPLAPVPTLPTPSARNRPVHRRPAPSCDPPFSIDANGTKIYKTECLR